MDQLPNEILTQIMSYLHGPMSLHAFVASHPQAKRLYQRHSREYLRDVMNNWNMPCEIQMLLCATIFVRQIHRRGYIRTLELEALLDYFLSGSNTDSVLKSDLLAAPMRFLAASQRVCSQIAKAEASFITYQISKMGSQIKVKKETGSGIGQAREGILDNWSLSSTEQYRVRRALYRLCLYYEIFNTLRNPENSENDIGNEFNRQRLFFRRLSLWEVEEMECVHHHLRYETHLWKKYCLNCNLLLLPDQLLEHSRRCGQAADTDRIRKLRRRYTFSGTCQLLRELIGRPFEKREIFWTDSPSAADHPSTGYLYLENHWDSLSPEYCYWEFLTRPDPVRRYHAWGYCIWDKERLEANELIDGPHQDKRAAHERWKTEFLCHYGPAPPIHSTCGLNLSVGHIVI